MARWGNSRLIGYSVAVVKRPARSRANWWAMRPEREPRCVIQGGGLINTKVPSEKLESAT